MLNVDTGAVKKITTHSLYLYVQYCRDPQMTCTHGSWNTTSLFVLNNWCILASKGWRIPPHTVTRFYYWRHNRKVRITIIYLCKTKHAHSGPPQDSIFIKEYDLVTSLN